ncbi:anti-sigma factor antagonist [Kitasatospora indigofera]|uniref:Anti-sigma factor antagonist n=1 Tax=Kitasatospora indigofera TaxID=67307 RepID=A0A919GDM0_9ACTN|nr:STAS domain-containing protein [Kitasatospora indigofera]GHH82081.1 anti-sigma factor antagonist [Kitasatospora indigofera]
MTDSAAARFTTADRDSPAGPVVEVTGELDYDSAPGLRTVLHRALAVRPAPPKLVIDLGGLTFCDSTGLNALLQARIDAERQGTVVHLARPTPAVARVLEITGADQVFPVDPGPPAVVPDSPTT